MTGAVRLLCRFLLLCCLAVTTSVVAETQSESADGQSLEVTDDLTLVGDVDLAELADQYPQGLLFVDLRTAEEEGVAQSREQALRLGMRYENIPVDGPHIVVDQVEQLRAVLSSRGAAEHALVRCGSGNRAAMMWGATRIDAGEDPEQVMTQLQTLITKPAIEQALREYAGHANR